MRVSARFRSALASFALKRRRSARRLDQRDALFDFRQRILADLTPEQMFFQNNGLVRRDAPEKVFLQLILSDVGAEMWLTPHLALPES